MKQLGAALRSLRVFHDLTQTDTAEKLAVSKSFLCEVESGKREPSLALLVRYAQVFGVPLSSLIFFAEELNQRSSSEPGIAPKILRLLDWIAEVKPDTGISQKKPPQKQGSRKGFDAAEKLAG